MGGSYCVLLFLEDSHTLSQNGYPIARSQEQCIRDFLDPWIMSKDAIKFPIAHLAKIFRHSKLVYYFIIYFFSRWFHSEDVLHREPHLLLLKEPRSLWANFVDTETDMKPHTHVCTHIHTHTAFLYPHLTSGAQNLIFKKQTDGRYHDN